MLINRVFRVKYKTKTDRNWSRRVKVFTEALSFAKTRCCKEKTATIEEILIYSDDTEKVATQWIVTPESHSIISREIKNNFYGCNINLLELNNENQNKKN